MAAFGEFGRLAFAETPWPQKVVRDLANGREETLFSSDVGERGLIALNNCRECIFESFVGAMLNVEGNEQQQKEWSNENG